MEITNVDAVTLTVPVEVPLLEEPLSHIVVLVTVETDAGITGYGETGMSTPGATARYVTEEIAPLVEGRDPLEHARIWDDLRRRLNPRDQTGTWSTAVSAVDIALWDVKGKAYDEPVWRLLGGARDTVPAYVTFGLPEFDEAQLVETAQRFVDRGADALKMVVAGREDSTPVSDARRVHAVRDAVGDGVELMIDANYHYTAAEALDLCNRIDDANVTFFEEPVAGNDEKLLAELRQRMNIPVAAGQNEGHRFRHRRLIAAGAVDVLQPNVCFCGGFTEGAKVAATADSFNLPIANGGAWPFHNMHLQAGATNGTRVEFHYMVWHIDEQLYREIPSFDAGTVALPEDPGLGLEPDWDAIETFRDE